MKDYTVNLTDSENKALEYAAISPSDWINNAVKNRCRIAIEEIISLNTAHCNNNSIAIAVGVDGQIAQAFDLGVVKKASEIAEQEELAEAVDPETT